ncbi:MAG: VOC family protein [Nitrospina sp.]|jgi:glyoxylase I family protein|nr:VOC family protein [Nitrospina sp.]MBT4899983.1 VOC family protein [Nitrospina sp.]
MTLKTSPTEIQLKGLHHFALNVKDMNRSERFYQQALGFPVINRTETRSGFKHFEIDTGNVVLALFESPDLDFDSAQKVMTDEGFLHFAFAAKPDQYENIIQSLKDHNIELDGEPRNYSGGTSIYFFDPDGHHLEIHFSD